LGHQSLFVLGRVCSGLGESIAGFSLSLAFWDTSDLSPLSLKPGA
jgi:hypothetical protein